MMIYLRLFYEFCKAGLFAVGGGLATVPFLAAMGQSTGWFTAGDLADMIAVSESTPGPLGVNMATYVGFEVGGVPGAAAATLGLIFPSIVIIVIIAAFLRKFRDSKYVEYVFDGLRPASTGLIAAACWGVIAICLLQVGAVNGALVHFSLNWQLLILAAVVFGCTNWEKLKKVHPIVWIALSAGACILFRL